MYCYYLTITAKRKNAKRHIVDKKKYISHLIPLAKNLNHDRYIVEIYNGRWELVQTV